MYKISNKIEKLKKHVNHIVDDNENSHYAKTQMECKAYNTAIDDVVKILNEEIRESGESICVDCIHLKYCYAAKRMKINRCNKYRKQIDLERT